MGFSYFGFLLLSFGAISPVFTYMGTHHDRPIKRSYFGDSLQELNNDDGVTGQGEGGQPVTETVWQTITVGTAGRAGGYLNISTPTVTEMATVTVTQLIRAAGNDTRGSIEKVTVTELMTTTIIQLIGCGTTLLPTSLETVVIPIDTGTIPPETSSSSVVDSIISSATSITTSLIGVAPGLATSAMQSASESSITSSTQSNPSSVSTPSHTSPLLETSPAPVQTPNANFATSIAALTATTFAGANEGPPINFSGVYLSSAINLGPLRESHRREKPQDGHEGDRAGNKPA